jgi:hypothetical protein
MITLTSFIAVILSIISALIVIFPNEPAVGKLNVYHSAANCQAESAAFSQDHLD